MGRQWRSTRRGAAQSPREIGDGRQPQKRVNELDGGGGAEIMSTVSVEEEALDLRCHKSSLFISFQRQLASQDSCMFIARRNDYNM